MGYLEFENDLNEGDVKQSYDVHSLEHQTEKAWLMKMDEDAEPIWLPFSQCDYDENEQIIWIPNWLAEEKGL